MITGGVEKALIGMLGVMCCTDEVDLYVEVSGGELFEELPDWIHIIEIPRKKWNTSNMSIFTKIKAMKSRIELYFCKDYIKQCELSARSFPVINKEYDLAIAYHAPNTIPVFYVINNLKAKKKILWLHGDVETNHMTGDLAEKYYEKYDKIFAVSQQSKKIFNRYFPKLSPKCEVFYNIINVEQLRKQAEIAPTYKDGFDGLRVLTIGRLDFQKGIDLAVEVCKKLLDNGLQVRWYVCGEGNGRYGLEQMIMKYQLQENFILLGNQKNPYGYLRDCDIYVQPSRYEGYCTTTNEALAFGKCIVVTDVCGMREQFVNRENGLLCEIDVDDIYEKIIELWKSQELQYNLMKNAQFIEKKEDINKLYLEESQINC